MQTLHAAQVLIKPGVIRCNLERKLKLLPGFVQFVLLDQGVPQPELSAGVGHRLQGRLDQLIRRLPHQILARLAEDRLPSDLEHDGDGEG